MRRFASLLFLLMCFGANVKAQSERTSIAIFPFSVSSSTQEYKARASQIQQSVMELLRNKSTIQIIDRSNDSLLIKELDLQIREQSIAAKNLVQQGKLLGAKQMIAGTLSSIVVESKKVNNLLSLQGNKTTVEFSASISFALQLSDVETGKVISQKVFNTKDASSGRLFNLANVGTGESREDAISNAIKASKKMMASWINESYPPDIRILKVDETDKKGNPETVLVTGIDASLQKGAQIDVQEVEMLDAGEGKKLKRTKKIAELKVKEMQGEITICRVTDGAKVLQEKITAGTRLEFTVK